MERGEWTEVGFEMQLTEQAMDYTMAVGKGAMGRERGLQRKTNQR